MLTTLLLLTLALSIPGLSQVTTPTIPTGYRAVYITSKVDGKFAIVPKAAKAGSTVVVQALASTPAQQWWLRSGGGGGGGVDSKIQLAGTALCLDAGSPKSAAAWKDMAAVYVRDCTEADDDDAATDPGQLWNVMADGRIALKASSPQECLDLQYMRATANNPVGLYACAGLGNAGAGDKGINWPLVNATTSAAA